MPGLANRKRRCRIIGLFRITEFWEDALMRLFCPTGHAFFAASPFSRL
jgi:hypothetical protein